MLRPLIRVFLWRIASAGSSFASNIILTRIIVEQYGTDAFAIVSLVISIPTLLPFLDLGMSSVLVNSSADISDERNQEKAAREFKAAVFILIVPAALLSAIAVIFAALNVWPLILGPATTGAPGLSIACSLVLAAVAVNLFTSVAGRILQGGRQNVLMIAISVVGPPITLGIAVLLMSLPAPYPFVGVASMASVVIVSALCWIPVVRMFRAIPLSAAKAKPTRSDLRSVVEIGSAGLIVSILIVGINQSDRLMLSFGSTATDLAAYSLVAPLYVAIWGTLNPLAMNLWPVYRDGLSSKTLTGKTLAIHILGFTIVGALFASLMILAGPFAVQLMSGENHTIVNSEVYWAFAALLVVQACQLPLSMVLTDTKGWKSQRSPYLIAFIVKICTTTFLLNALGASAPVIGTVCALAVVITPVLTVRVRQRLRYSDK